MYSINRPESQVAFVSIPRTIRAAACDQAPRATARATVGTRLLALRLFRWNVVLPTAQEHVNGSALLARKLSGLVRRAMHPV